jgi:hypothetical protein
MLTRTEYKIVVPLNKIEEALYQLPRDDFRFTLNRPSGNFLYDPWIIKDEYSNTVWDTLLSTLPANIGEARVIILDGGQCYQSHGDIDNRYHLNLTGSMSYAVNLETNTIFEMLNDGYWYDFDAGLRHSAANFGRDFRAQLVVRKLLIKNTLNNPAKLRIISSLPLDDTRFVGENTVTPWLNRADKQGIITDLTIADTGIIEFLIEKDQIPNLTAILPRGFIAES